MLEIGETVMAQFALKKLGYGMRKAQKNKLVARAVKAVWVGQISRTGEQIVIKPHWDAARCRTVHRVPVEDRWDAEAVLSVKGTPRRPTPSQADQNTIKAPIAREEERPEGAEDEGAQIVDEKLSRDDCKAPKMQSPVPQSRSQRPVRGQKPS